jgi:hypothetical protein
LLNLRTAHPARITLSLAILSTCVASPAALAAQQTAPQQQREHVVRKGDTLWDLAALYLSNPFQWPLIFDANRGVVENPHWIYPAERLIIPPVLQDQTAVAVAVQPVAPEPAVATSPGEPARSRFYNPPMPPRADDEATVLVSEGQSVYPVSPAEYRTVAWLADSAQLPVVGRLEAMEDPSRAEDKLASKLHPYDRVHVGRLQGRRPSNGDTLLIVRLGRPVEGHGRVIEPVALLEVDGGTSSMLTGSVVALHGDGRLGDLVIERGAMPAIAAGAPQAVSNGAEGTVVDLLVQQPYAATADHAFVDLGRAQGLAIGDELMAYVPERLLREERSERVPATEVATLRVVRVENGTATVRVVGMRYPALAKGLAVRVVRKMR